MPSSNTISSCALSSLLALGIAGSVAVPATLAVADETCMSPYMRMATTTTSVPCHSSTQCLHPPSPAGPTR
jgi:hypothetical protein